MAGVAYQVTHGIVLDLGYRFLWQNAGASIYAAFPHWPRQPHRVRHAHRSRNSHSAAVRSQLRSGHELLRVAGQPQTCLVSAFGASDATREAPQSLVAVDSPCRRRPIRSAGHLLPTEEAAIWKDRIMTRLPSRPARRTARISPPAPAPSAPAGPPSPRQGVPRPLAPRQGRQGAPEARHRQDQGDPRPARRLPRAASCRAPTPAPSRWRCGPCSARAASMRSPGRASARAGSPTSPSN